MLKLLTLLVIICIAISEETDPRHGDIGAQESILPIKTPYCDKSTRCPNKSHCCTKNRYCCKKGTHCCLSMCCSVREKVHEITAALLVS